MKDGKQVLVIGGGCAGVSFISGLRKLDAAVEIILVEPKDFCELIWASYRSPFDEDVARDSTVPLGEYCKEKNVRHLRSKVTKVTEKEAELEDGTNLEFDACVVTVGASMSWKASGNGLPKGYNGDREERLSRMKEHGEKLLNAQKVAILGGGLVGVELAGDVAGYRKLAKKDVRVTLVHSGPRIMQEFTEGASAMAHRKLEDLGVRIVLNERGVEKEGKVVLQTSEEEIEADEIVSAIGLSSNNSFLKIDGVCNEKGFLKTDKFYRLDGCGPDGKVFAYGDCCEELRNSAYVVMLNGPTIAHNVKAALDGNDGSCLKPFDKGMSGGMVTIGPNDGVAQLPFTYTQYLLPRYKNRTMMFPSSKPLMGVR